MDMNSLPEEDRVKLMKTIDEVQTNVRYGIDGKECSRTATDR